MELGGAEKIVFQLCVDNLRDEQIVISCGGAYVDELRNAGIKHYRIPDINNKNPLQMARCFFCILYVTKQEKIDVLHSHHRMAAFYSRLVSLLTGAKNVYTAHSIFSDKYILTRFSIQKASVVAVGDSVKRNLIDFFRINENQITTIYNSIKIKENEPGEIILDKMRKSGKILIGIIGRIIRKKGIDTFIKGIDICRQSIPDVIGVIIGDGEDLRQMKYMVRKRRLQKNILFLGYKDNVLDIIRQLDFTVSASRHEGLPLTPIETFSQGKTIVASNIPGNNEIITDNLNGLLFEVDNEEELADKMINLINDKTLLLELEINAIKTYNEKYDYKKFIASYQKFYQNL